ncbi:MAG: UDP-glucuronate decarboxylase [Bacteroidota bacterium]|nr:UDP-glucuronate decarboxylase [Bacteroidota bacterium]
MLNKIITEDLEYITGCVLGWEVLDNSTVLISGINGFLPSYLRETLFYLNDRKGFNIRIIGIDREGSAPYEKFYTNNERSYYRYITQDISKSFSFDEKVDYVIHAASQASPKFYGTDPVGTLSANILGTYNLLSISQEGGAKGFLFFSSGEIYGIVSEVQIPTKETDYGWLDPMNIRSCYAESKRMGENLCVSWSHQFGLPCKIIRPFHIYGPGIRLDDGRVQSDFIGNVAAGKDIVIKSDGKATRSFLYIADATLAFFTALLKGEDRAAYNIASHDEISINELAEKLIALFPEKNLKIDRQIRTDNMSYMPSPISRNKPAIDRLLALGWKQGYSIEEGLRRTALCYM